MKVGNCSGRDVQKFAAFGLTAATASTIEAPLISECFANLECRVIDTRMVNKYCLFILEVTKAWVDSNRADAKTTHHRGYGSFSVDGEIIHIASRMP